MLKVTEAEKVLVKELNDFKREYESATSAFHDGFVFAVEVLKAEDEKRICQTIGSLYTAIRSLEIKINEEEINIAYNAPEEGRIIHYGKSLEKELSEKVLCGILMSYQRNVENNITLLMAKVDNSIFLYRIKEDLNKIFSKYFSI